MDELDQRLIQCFRAVFPDFSDEEILSSNRSEQNEWDSLASLVLWSVLEEEFGCELNEADIERLDSFAAARAAVQHAAA